ncbi:MAG: CHASE2 domain-containing serine/threonine-protein kinase [Steroidobacter sp.]
MAAKLARFSWLPGGLAAALVIAVGRLLSSTSYAPLELALYDRVLRSTHVSPSQEIVVVAIDEASIARLGEWPWPRDVHAGLLDQLHSQGAGVVAFTAPFDTSQRTSESERVRGALALLESSNLGNSEQARQLRRMLGESTAGRDPDAHVARAMAAHGDVIAPVEVRVGETSREPLDAPPGLRPLADSESIRTAVNGRIVQKPGTVLVDAASAVGHTLLMGDADGVVRSDLTAVRIGDSLLPSLASVIAARALGVTSENLAFADGRLTLGDNLFALDPDLRVRPHYFAPAPASAFVQLPYWQVAAGDVSSGQLRDKIVVIGFTDGSLAAASAVNTPGGRSTPAVITIASTVSSLLTDAVYARPTLALALEWIAALGVIAFAAVILPGAGIALGALATVLIIAILLVGEIGLLSSAQIWARLMLPCVAVLAGYGLYLVGEMIRRANIRNDGAREPAANLRNLGQTFQKQGQLDLAFETYQRCPLDAPTMDLLYQLGLDFERRRQLQKAAAVYNHMASRDPNYRDLRARRGRVQGAPPAREAPVAAARSTAPAVPPRESGRIEVEDFEPRVPARTSSRTLGRYEIERELGKGAMGIVYLGRDPKINRVVAIKAIPLAEEFEEGDLAEARARFFREAEMAGRLNHPAIVTVYDAGEDQGLAYIAMEYLRGQHLSHFTDPSRLLRPENVILLVARVAEALHYAHRQNVVHRDIKPANIMFDPDTDELKITDFGIARLTDTSRTKTGIVLGTPSFMSPEQLEGRTLDGRSDQFALGVSLFQLLCGQLPFRAESMPRLMHKIATEPHASVRVIRPELPEAIDAVIDRALSKPADDRYANCGEFAAALRGCASSIERPRAAESAHEWLIP